MTEIKLVIPKESVAMTITLLIDNGDSYNMITKTIGSQEILKDTVIIENKSSSC